MAPKMTDFNCQDPWEIISIKIWWPRCPSSSPKGAARRRGPHKLRSDHFLWTSSHQAAARWRVGPPLWSFFWKTSQTSWDHLSTNAEIHFTESLTWRFACVSQCCWSSWNNRPLVTHFGMQNLFFRTFILPGNHSVHHPRGGRSQMNRPRQIKPTTLLLDATVKTTTSIPFRPLKLDLNNSSFLLPDLFFQLSCDI